MPLRDVGPFPGLQVVPPLDSDLVSVPVADPPIGSHKLSYHGGPTLKQPQVLLVYLGPFWEDPHWLEPFVKSVVEDGYLDPLAAYGSGRGVFLGGKVGPTLTGDVHDSDVRNALQQGIAAGTLPPPNPNLLYVACLPAGVHVAFDGSTERDCTNFCGYHTSYGPLIYAVQPATTCPTCNQGVARDGFQMVIAHEIAEAATDPLGSGWYEDSTGMENADICAWIPRSYNGAAIQGYWTNEGANTVGAYAPVPPPVKQPPPLAGPAAPFWQYCLDEATWRASVGAPDDTAQIKAWLAWYRAQNAAFA